MALIIRDPLVEDYIREIDLSVQGAQDEARRLYEDGCLILLKDQRLDLDYAFLNSLDFNITADPQVSRKVKKYDDRIIRAIRPDSSEAADQKVFAEVFKSDAGLLAYFQEQVASGGKQIEALHSRVFPNYRSYRSAHTWRFTETLFENLHWDNFHIPEKFHQVRVFSNIDRSPRLWRTSHLIETYAEAIYEAHQLGQLAHCDADRLNYVINNKVLGGMDSQCLDRMPKHHIAFEQGDVWLCETRIVSHQIYCGQRAVATMFYIESASMDDPSKAFDSRIARLHQRHAEPASTAATGVA